MRNFLDTFETRKQSFISAFSIFMSVPFTQFAIPCNVLSVLASFPTTNLQIF